MRVLLSVAALAFLAPLLVSSAASGAAGRGMESEVGRALARAGGDASDAASRALSSAERTAYVTGEGLVEECAGVLERYRGRGDCSVASAGYLDLSGRTWGCVIQGRGWVELCLVRQRAGGGRPGGCEVVVWRMDAGDVPVPPAGP